MSESHRPCIARRFSKETERRLEEIRQILNEAKPLPEPSTLERLDAEAIVDRAAFKRRFGRDCGLTRLSVMMRLIFRQTARKGTSE